jgi:type I restriction enzyme S subunit
MSRAPDWARRKVGEVIAVQPRRYKIQTGEYRAAGAYPVIDQGAHRVGGYIDDNERLYDGELPVIVFGDHTCCLKWVDHPFAIGADGTQLLRAVEGVDHRFLYYLLHTTSLKQFGYQRHFKLLKECEVSVPPSLDLQRQIAAILSAYDDLIEVNTRRIGIMEEMARRLFVEWFKKRQISKEAQCLPLSELVTEIRDAVLPSEVPFDTPYVGLEHMPRRSLTLVDWGRADQVASTKHRFKSGDILFGKIRPYFHKVIIAPFDGVASSDAIVMRPTNEQARAIAACLASSDEFVAHAVQTSNGTKMPRANWGVLQKYEIAYSDDAARDFARVVIPLQNLSTTFAVTNINLRAARDLLLPKLISGEIDLERAESEAREAAE